MEYAAGDVRFLLPVANNLLQQLPAAIMELASLQLLIAQQGAAALQLEPSMLPAYSPLLQEDHGPSTPSSSVMQPATNILVLQQPVLFNTSIVFRQQPMVHMLFELHLQQLPGGWYQPAYQVLLHDVDDISSAASAAAHQGPLTAKNSSSSSSMNGSVPGSTPAAAIEQEGIKKAGDCEVVAADAAADDVRTITLVGRQDEASLLQLLPDKLSLLHVA